MDAVGVDNSAEMVAHAGGAGHFVVRGDLCNLAFAGGVFARVWASASLVHFDDVDAARALTELARVAVPGGRARVTVKASGGGRGHGGWEGEGPAARWFRYWELDRFVALAEGCGWSCTDARLEADSRRAGLEWVTTTFEKR